MFVGFAFKEGDEGGHFASLNLGCELASSSVLLFCFSSSL
jgi:hypothetical protein